MKSNRVRRTVASLVHLSVLALLAPALAQPNLDELVRQSTFIVQGAVTRTGAATTPEVPVSENTIVVKVSQVHQAPKAMARLAGQEITVLVKNPAELKIGDQAVFFAQGWLVGDGVAVQEVGRLKGKGDADLAKRIARARVAAADQDLKGRIGNAELVVVGKVSGVTPRPPSVQAPITEHDPAWQEAVVELSAVLKGDPSLKKVTVVFPGSVDVAWVGVPKLKVGQEGIWILQRDRELQGYIAPDPLDVQPSSQLARIKRLLKGTG